jgi:hypothetical protein
VLAFLFLESLLLTGVNNTLQCVHTRAGGWAACRPNLRGLPVCSELLLLLLLLTLHHLIYLALLLLPVCLVPTSDG